MATRQLWVLEEDQKLMEAVAKFGPRRWGYIATFIESRTGKQCRERWFHHVNPGIRKGAWTPEEDATILKMVQIHGRRWSLIARALSGRTDNAVKNRHESYLKRRFPETHTPTTPKKRPYMMHIPVGTSYMPASHAPSNYQPNGMPPTSAGVLPAGAYGTHVGPGTPLQTVQRPMQQPATQFPKQVAPQHAGGPRHYRSEQVPTAPPSQSQPLDANSAAFLPPLRDMVRMPAMVPQIASLNSLTSVAEDVRPADTAAPKQAVQLPPPRPRTNAITVTQLGTDSLTGPKQISNTPDLAVTQRRGIGSEGTADGEDDTCYDSQDEEEGGGKDQPMKQETVTVKQEPGSDSVPSAVGPAQRDGPLLPGMAKPAGPEDKLAIPSIDLLWQAAMSELQATGPAPGVAVVAPAATPAPGQFKITLPAQQAGQPRHQPLASYTTVLPLPR